MIRSLGWVAAGAALLISPLLMGPGIGQSPPDGGAVGASLPQAGLPWAAQVPAGRFPPTGASTPAMGGVSAGQMMGFSRPSADGGQLLTLIDTSRQWMAVYHIEGSGEIRLKGSRPLGQDFAVEFNTVAPLPKEIRQLTAK